MHVGMSAFATILSNIKIGALSGRDLYSRLVCLEHQWPYSIAPELLLMFKLH